MPVHSEGRHGESAEDRERFDAETMRRILHRAAEEQQRMEGEQLDSYSIEELEDIATEAGISPEAMHAALEAYRDKSAPDAYVPGAAPEKEASGWLALLESWLPGTWSRRSKRAVLLGAGAALLALLLFLPGVGPVVVWATVASLLILVLLLLIGVLF